MDDEKSTLKGRAYAILWCIVDPPKALCQYRESDGVVGAVFTFSIPVEINDSSTARKVRAVPVGPKWVIMEPARARRQPRNFTDPESALLRGTGSHVGGSDPLPRYRGYEKLLRATQNKSLGTNHDDDWGSLFKECLAVPIEET